MKRSRAQGPTTKPTAGREGVNVLGDGALVTFVPRPYRTAEADALFQELRDQTSWLKREVFQKGKTDGSTVRATLHD